MSTGLPPHETEKRIVAVRGHRIRVAVDTGTSRSASDRPPLLLCNGISAKLEAFDPFVRAMPADRDIIRFDAPGVGGSPTPARPYRFRGLASLVAAMVRELGYERIDVLGISWGGALAQQLAFQDTSLCRRLVLVSTATGSLMVPPHPRVLRHMATPRRYRDPVHGASIAGMIYGGSARHEAGVPLETYEHFADRDPLARVVLERMLAGVSTRRFPRTQEPVGESVEAEARSTSKSAVSRDVRRAHAREPRGVDEPAAR